MYNSLPITIKSFDMRKLSLFLLGCFITVVLAPFAFAKSDKAVYIKSVDVYAQNQQNIGGDMTVCASKEDAKFEVKVLNTVTNAMYSRKLLIKDGGCDTVDLHFNEAFSEISKAGDKLKFTLANIKMDGDRYANTDPVFKAIEDERDVKEPCGDASGNDDVYSVCAGDFVTHTPTGVRMKVVNIENNKVELIVTGIQWGGPKKMNIYIGKTKDVVAKDMTKISITNTSVGGGLVSLQIES